MVLRGHQVRLSFMKCRFRVRLPSEFHPNTVTTARCLWTGGVGDQEPAQLSDSARAGGGGARHARHPGAPHQEQGAKIALSLMEEPLTLVFEAGASKARHIRAAILQCVAYTEGTSLLPTA